MKKIMAILLLAIMMVSVTVPAQAQTTHYRSMTVKVDKPKKQKQYNATVYWKGKRVAVYKFQRKPVVRFVQSKNLTYKKLSTRKGKVLYIEILDGVVLDNKGNGKVLNGDPVFNYINYRRTGYRKGTRVRTYCVFNPYNNAEDDIVKRFDERR